MIRLFIFAIAVICFGWMATTSWSQDSPTVDSSVQQLLDVRATKFGEFRAAKKEGRIDEAIVALESVAELERNLSRELKGNEAEEAQQTLANVRVSLGNALTWLSNRYKERDEFAKAIAVQKEFLELQSSIFGPDHFQVADAQRQLLHFELQARLTPGQREQLHQANGQESRVVTLYQATEYAQALPFAKSVAETRKRVLGENHLLYANSLNLIAVIHQAMSDQERAEPLLSRAIEIFERVLGKEHPNYAISLNNLAMLYQDMNDYGRAEPLFIQSMRIRKRVLGEDHRDYATSLYSLAKLYQAMRDYERAEPLYSQAINIRKRALGEWHPVYASSLYDLAECYREMGDYERAEPFYCQAIEIEKQALGEEHPDYGTSLFGLASLYHTIGDYRRAEQLYLQAMKIDRQTFGVEHLGYAKSLNNLAALYVSMGDYGRAEQFHTQSMEVLQRTVGEEHPDYAASLNNLALLYQRMGDYTRAERLISQAVQINKQALGEEHPSYATSLNNLAVLYKVMGDPARAEPLYLQAIEILERAYDEDHPTLATSLHNLSEFYREMGDHVRAEPILLRAIEIRKLALGEEHPDYATSLNNLGMIYQRIEDYERAESLLAQAMEIRKRVLGEDHADYATSLNNLAAFYHLTGDYGRAAELAHRSLEITQQLLETASIALSERQQLAMSVMFRYQLNNWLSIGAHQDDSAEALFRAVLAWKGATLVRQRSMRQLSQRPEIAESFQQLQRTTMQLAALSRAVPASKQLEDWKGRLRDLRNHREKQEVELSRKSAVFRAAKEDISLEDLRASLPSDSVLIDFLEYTRTTPSEEHKGQFEFQRSLVAFVVRPDGDVQRVDLGSVSGLSDEIESWRDTFGTSTASKAAGSRLRQRVWQPLLSHIEDSKTVIVSLDGVLGRLPLGALPGKEPDTYLVEDHRLVLVPVPQLIPALLEDEPVKGPPQSLLVMGDVNYDASPFSVSADPTEPVVKEPVVKEPDTTKPVTGGTLLAARAQSTHLVRDTESKFRHLSGTATELKLLQELFSRVRPDSAESIATLHKADATEERFRQTAPKFASLHLATHGFFASPEKQSAMQLGSRSLSRGRMFGEQREQVRGFSPGLLSGLVFAGANRKSDPDQDDGIMTADEIAFLPLENVDLVVLSACETGLGEVAGGEGLLGLQRAFQVSGANTVVSSLWEVDDWATQLLMDRFYRNRWEKNLSALDSLREAQLWMLRHPKELRQAAESRGAKRVDVPESFQVTPPQLWAAFVLSGDWR